jgi:aldehyde dehydrogenase (NAD+)
MWPQCARYFEFYGGAADKLTGETIPYPSGYTVLTWREPHGVTGPHHSLELSAADLRPLRRRCARRRQRVRRQAAEDACVSLLRVAELAASIGFPEGALNLVTGSWSGGGRRARGPSWHRASFVHRIARDRRVRRRRRQRSGTVRSRWSSAARARKSSSPMRSRCRAARGRQRDRAERRDRRARQEAVFSSSGSATRKCWRSSDPLRALEVGPALDDLDCGPLIRATQLARVRGFLDDAKRDGRATVAKGTVVAHAPSRGFYIEPQLLRDVPPDSRLGREEVFGPVLAAMPFTDEADAVRIANATEFGLVAGCGRKTARGRCAWRARSGAARCSSTTTAPAGA